MKKDFQKRPRFMKRGLDLYEKGLSKETHIHDKRPRSIKLAFVKRHGNAQHIFQRPRSVRRDPDLRKETSKES